MSTSKHKGKGPQVMTANDLKNGAVVWMTADWTWSQIFAQALQSEDPEIIANMQDVATRDEDANLVVAAYLIDLDPDTGAPARYREKFRVSGPTNDLSYAKIGA